LNKTYFRETQKFTQWWLWLILLALTAISLYGLLKAVRVNDIGINKENLVDNIIPSAVCLGVLALFGILRMETEIGSKGIYMEFFPFVKKHISWTDIKSLNIVKYGFVGYGIRLGSKYGTVYNTKGNKGLWVQLKNGKTFVIGTQKQNELKRLIKTERILKLID